MPTVPLAAKDAKTRAGFLELSPDRPMFSCFTGRAGGCPRSPTKPTAPKGEPAPVPEPLLVRAGRGAKARSPAVADAVPSAPEGPHGPREPPGADGLDCEGLLLRAMRACVLRLEDRGRAYDHDQLDRYGNILRNSSYSLMCIESRKKRDEERRPELSRTNVTLGEPVTKCVFSVGGEVVPRGPAFKVDLY